MNTVDEILDYAIDQEQQAADFYQDVAQRAETAGMKKILLDFSEEEKSHKKILQNFFMAFFFFRKVQQNFFHDGGLRTLCDVFIKVSRLLFLINSVIQYLINGIHINLPAFVFLRMHQG